MEKVGKADPWSTPLWLGISGLLFSPSRGILFFSPFLFFAGWGVARIWRDPQWKELRALTVATLAIFLVESKWFDWWGGWSYGYRHVVDLSLFFTLFILPIIQLILTHKITRIVFISLLFWSISVQAVGAFAYDVKSWNSRVIGYQLVDGQGGTTTVHDQKEAKAILASKKAKFMTEIRADIDRPEHRSRLWSISDCEPIFYLMRWNEMRRVKEAILRDWVGKS